MRPRPATAPAAGPAETATGAGPSPYTLLARLLEYPAPDILAGRPEIAAALNAMEGAPWAAAPLREFLSWWTETPGWEVQAAYVSTFDTGRRCSLYLTYPLFGDRRERGMALLRLKRRYAAHGLVLAGAELPDFLPVVLEYAADDPDGEALLAEHRVSLELLRAALETSGDRFATPVSVLCDLLGPLTDEERQRVRQIAEHGPPMEEVGLEPFAPPEFMPRDPQDVRR